MFPVDSEKEQPAEVKPEPVPKFSKPLDTKGHEDMNVEKIRELIFLLDETSLAELEIEGPEFRINLRKSGSESRSGVSPHKHRIREKQKANEERYPPEDLIEVTAPMVGTFYRSPSPDAPPFVEEGSYVEAGQTLCIVEAMKLMNEIKSEFRGKLVEILVDNGQPVEYGQIMFLIVKE